MMISNFNFHGPFDPTRGFDRVISAVYAILDSSNRVLDVGQTEDLNNRFPNHPRQSQWIKNGIGLLNLYFLEVDSKDSRLQIESQIRAMYNPPCGDF